MSSAMRLARAAVAAWCLAGLLPAEAAPAVCRYGRYWNRYHDSFVYKVFVKSVGSDRPSTTLDEATNIIARVNRLTGGMHQIVYLVGCTHGGLDNKFPSWDVIGDACKSSFSDDPRESLRRMIRESRRYNADVSLHINMDDAYTNSPLWQTYVDNDLLCREKDGTLHKANVYNGLQSYRVSHAKEWEKGFARQRIDRFLAMLPEVRESHTVHLDSFVDMESPKDGIDFAKDAEAMCRIVDYWHEQGVDATAEYLSAYELVGRVPLVHHLNTDELGRLQYPPEVLSGGNASWNTRQARKPFPGVWKAFTPQAGCLYEEAWGDGHWDDLYVSKLKSQGPAKFRSCLYNTAVRAAYLNRSRPVRQTMDLEQYVVERENGVVARVRLADRALTVCDGERTVIEGGDMFLDFPYGGGTVLAYSERGCDRDFALPGAFAAAKALGGTHFPSEKAVSLPVVSGRVHVRLGPMESLVLKVGSAE